jgi:hypothetical protein
MRDKISPIIITFIGPVGVGKSTQMRLLAQYFRSKNRKTIETYIKSAHGTTFILNYLIEKMIEILKKNNTSINKDLERRMFSRITPLWNFSDTMSILVKFFFSVYIPFQLGYNILLEEGLYMSIENYRIFRPYFLGVKQTRMRLLDLLLRWVNCHNHLDIVLDATDDELGNRRLSRSFRQTESENYIRLQRKSMSRLVEPRFLRINTSGKSAKSVNNIIVSYVLKKGY